MVKLHVKISYRLREIFRQLAVARLNALVKISVQLAQAERNTDKSDRTWPSPEFINTNFVDYTLVLVSDFI